MRMQRCLLAFLAFFGVAFFAEAAYAARDLVVSDGDAGPTSHAFGGIPVNTAATPKTFDATNTGSPAGDIVISDVTSSGSCTGFSISPDPNGVVANAITLAQNASQTFTVSYTPTTITSTATCTFTIVDDDGDGTADQYQVTGNGTGVVLSPNPSGTLNIGDVRVNTTSSGSTITITNNGNQTLNVTAMAISGTHASQFAIESPSTPFNVNASATQDVTITCTPTSAGAKSAQIDFTSNNTTGFGDTTVLLSCNGTEPGLSLNPSTTLNIGSVRLGQSATGFVRVTNNGDATLSVTHMQITGADADEFEFVDHSCDTFTPDCETDYTVGAGAFSDVYIRCVPDSASGASGTLKTATLAFTSDAPGTPDNQVTLNCTGVEPAITLNPATTLAIGNVHIGSTSSNANVRVTNNGSATLNVTSMSITGTNASQFRFNDGTNCNTQACTVGYTVATGGAAFHDVPIVCTPQSPRSPPDKTALLTINSDSGGDETVDLTCTATLPALSLSPVGGGTWTPPLSCGSEPVNDVGGTVTTCQFQINNRSADSSNETLDWTVMSSNSTEFAVSASSGQTAVDGITVITITFDPTGSGTRTSTITVGGDGSGNQAFTVNGTGTVPTISTSTASPVSLGDVDITTPTATTSAPVTISLTTGAGAPLQIQSVVLTGGNAAMFDIASGTETASTVVASSTASWTVTCTPTGTAGLKTTTFRITHDAPNGAPNQTLDKTLNCNGIRADLTVTGTLAFGSVLENTTANDSVTITNSSSFSKTVSLTSVTSPSSVYVATFDPGGTSATIAPGASVDLDVAFTPVNGATSNGNFVVAVGTAATVEYPSFNIGVTGDGIHEGFDVTVADSPANPSAWAIGDLRVLTMEGSLVTLQNSSDVPININAPTTNNAQCALQLLSPTSYPFLNVAPGNTATFNLNVTPNAIGAGTCTIGLTGQIPSTSTALNEMIVVTWNGVAPEVTLLAPSGGAALDFVGVDIDSTPVQLPVQIQNSGSADLVITSCTVTGADAAKFTVPTCSATLTPGGDTIVMVTYDPTLEALDAATLTFTSDAFPVGTIVVDLEGVGLDQHINLPALSYTFPQTFRNPDDPPSQFIVVEDPVNVTTGTAAPLNISMAVTDAAADQVFVLPDAGPFVVQPGMDIDIEVEFRPTAYAQFDGIVTIYNDTTGNPMAEVEVHGAGVSRNVMVTPGDNDLGLTGVNVPIRLTDRLPDGLRITNVDPADITYRVARLELVDPSSNPLDPTPLTDTPFALIAEDDLEIAPDQTASYDVEFAPVEEGEFEVGIAVYLDNDPVPHAIVRLTGTAVEVELRGGGCQAGGNPSSGALVLLGLGLLGLRRRRAALLAAAVVLLLASVASAQTRDIDLQTFSPAPATEVETFAVESASVGVDGAWALDLMFSHATNLLMVTSSSAAAAGMEPDTPVSARSSVQLGFAYAFMGKFEGGLRVPMYQQSGSAPQFSGLQPAEGTALGDLAAHGKANLLQTDSLALGASLDLTLPTGKNDQFAGVDLPTGHVRALGGWRARRFGVNGNLGFIGRKTADLGNIEQGSALTFGAGAWFRALESMYVIGEAFGSAGMGGAGVKQAEGVLGVRYEVAQSIGVSVGGGRGIISGIGSPDLRAFLLVDVAPKARKADPLKIIVPPPPRDTRDNDADGIVNADDKCVDEAEDLDDFDDLDGCREEDNDGDGIWDVEDKCKTEAEDVDHHLDEDGCVDTDNDGDAILDLDDKCPMEQEDKDNYLDSDGCDDPDNDGDGILDFIDQCALEQETINGNNDDDGCPDNGDSLVMVMPDRIEIFEAVTFQGTTSKLSKKSANVLSQVAATMRANRDFKRVRVTVHVHPRDSGDQELSNERAKVVREWLVKWGIEPERVESRGLGSTRPLMDKKKKGAAAVNDRVEFIILEKDAETTKTP